MVSSQKGEDEQFYRDTEVVAFPKISDRQLALLEPLGERLTLRRGELIFRAGQRDLARRYPSARGQSLRNSRRDRADSRFTGQARFYRHVAMLQGTSALASARVKSEEAEILQVPAGAVRRALAGLPGVADPVVNAFIMRRPARPCVQPSLREVAQQARLLRPLVPPLPSRWPGRR